MKLTDLLERFSRTLKDEREQAVGRGLDAPVTVTDGRRLATSGTLHLYAFRPVDDATFLEDLPISILLPEESEPVEGFVVASRQLEAREPREILIQSFDTLGETVSSATIIPDAAGFFETAAKRLSEAAIKLGTYSGGPAERLIPWLDPTPESGDPSGRGVTSAVLQTIWTEDLAERRTKLTTLVVALVRQNKRLLLISRNHHSADEMLGTIARAMHGAGLPYKSLLCRYEMPIGKEAAGMALSPLGFEAQMHQFYARSQADKAGLRRKYERFRELTPLLAYKAEKQRDLNEVKLLEWRLLTQLSEVQANIKQVDETLAEYDSLPIWKRLAMQTAGKNVQSLQEYRALYEENVQDLLRELETAKHRIEELTPEAAIPKELRPEYNDLKQEIKRLGGTKRIREMLAAEEGTNRQAFLQNKKVVVTTAGRVVSDPLFGRVRFDMLVADEAPFIPAPFLLAAATLVRERIILSGDTRDIANEPGGAEGLPLWRQQFLPRPSSVA